MFYKNKGNNLQKRGRTSRFFVFIIKEINYIIDISISIYNENLYHSKS